MARDLSAPRIADWVRFYKSAPEGYKPHALTAVLRSDGPKMLAAVLASLGLEDSNALVRDWGNDERSAAGSRKDVVKSPNTEPLQDV